MASASGPHETEIIKICQDLTDSGITKRKKAIESASSVLRTEVYIKILDKDDGTNEHFSLWLQFVESAFTCMKLEAELFMKTCTPSIDGNRPSPSSKKDRATKKQHEDSRSLCRKVIYEADSRGVVRLDASVLVGYVLEVLDDATLSPCLAAEMLMILNENVLSTWKHWISITTDLWQTLIRSLSSCTAAPHSTAHVSLSMKKTLEATAAQSIIRPSSYLWSYFKKQCSLASKTSGKVVTENLMESLVITVRAVGADFPEQVYRLARAVGNVIPDCYSKCSEDGKVYVCRFIDVVCQCRHPRFDANAVPDAKEQAEWVRLLRLWNQMFEKELHEKTTRANCVSNSLPTVGEPEFFLAYGRTLILCSLIKQLAPEVTRISYNEEDQTPRKKKTRSGSVWGDLLLDLRPTSGKTNVLFAWELTLYILRLYPGITALAGTDVLCDVMLSALEISSRPDVKKKILQTVHVYVLSGHLAAVGEVATRSIFVERFLTEAFKATTCHEMEAEACRVLHILIDQGMTEPDMSLFHQFRLNCVKPSRAVLALLQRCLHCPRFPTASNYLSNGSRDEKWDSFKCRKFLIEWILSHHGKLDNGTSPCDLTASTLVSLLCTSTGWCQKCMMLPDESCPATSTELELRILHLDALPLLSMEGMAQCNHAAGRNALCSLIRLANKPLLPLLDLVCTRVLEFLQGSFRHVETSLRLDWSFMMWELISELLVFEEFASKVNNEYGDWLDIISDRIQALVVEAQEDGRDRNEVVYVLLRRIPRLLDRVRRLTTGQGETLTQHRDITIVFAEDTTLLVGMMLDWTIQHVLKALNSEDQADIESQVVDRMPISQSEQRNASGTVPRDSVSSPVSVEAGRSVLSGKRRMSVQSRKVSSVYVDLTSPGSCTSKVNRSKGDVVSMDEKNDNGLYSKRQMFQNDIKPDQISWDRKYLSASERLMLDALRTAAQYFAVAFKWTSFSCPSSTTRQIWRLLLALQKHSELGYPHRLNFIINALQSLLSGHSPYLDIQQVRLISEIVMKILKGNYKDFGFSKVCLKIICECVKYCENIEVLLDSSQENAMSQAEKDTQKIWTLALRVFEIFSNCLTERNGEVNIELSRLCIAVMEKDPYAGCNCKAPEKENEIETIHVGCLLSNMYKDHQAWSRRGISVALKRCLMMLHNTGKEYCRTLVQQIFQSFLSQLKSKDEAIETTNVSVLETSATLQLQSDIRLLVEIASCAPSLERVAVWTAVTLVEDSTIEILRTELVKYLKTMKLSPRVWSQSVIPALLDRWYGSTRTFDGFPFLAFDFDEKSSIWDEFLWNYVSVLVAVAIRPKSVRSLAEWASAIVLAKERICELFPDDEFSKLVIACGPSVIARVLSLPAIESTPVRDQLTFLERQLGFMFIRTLVNTRLLDVVICTLEGYPPLDPQTSLFGTGRFENDAADMLVPAVFDQLYHLVLYGSSEVPRNWIAFGLDQRKDFVHVLLLRLKNKVHLHFERECDVIVAVRTLCTLYGQLLTAGMDDSNLMFVVRDILGTLQAVVHLILDLRTGMKVSAPTWHLAQLWLSMLNDVIPPICRMENGYPRTKMWKLIMPWMESWNQMQSCYRLAFGTVFDTISGYATQLTSSLELCELIPNRNEWKELRSVQLPSLEIKYPLLTEYLNKFFDYCDVHVYPSTGSHWKRLYASLKEGSVFIRQIKKLPVSTVGPRLVRILKEEWRHMDSGTRNDVCRVLGLLYGTRFDPTVPLSCLNAVDDVKRFTNVSSLRTTNMLVIVHLLVEEVFCGRLSFQREAYFVLQQVMPYFKPSNYQNLAGSTKEFLTMGLEPCVEQQLSASMEDLALEQATQKCINNDLLKLIEDAPWVEEVCEWQRSLLFNFLRLDLATDPSTKHLVAFIGVLPLNILIVLVPRVFVDVIVRLLEMGSEKSDSLIRQMARAFGTAFCKCLVKIRNSGDVPTRNGVEILLDVLVLLRTVRLSCTSTPGVLSTWMNSFWSALLPMGLDVGAVANACKYYCFAVWIYEAYVASLQSQNGMYVVHAKDNRWRDGLMDSYLHLGDTDRVHGFTTSAAVPSWAVEAEKCRSEWGNALQISSGMGMRAGLSSQKTAPGLFNSSFHDYMKFHPSVLEAEMQELRESYQESILKWSSWDIPDALPKENGFYGNLVQACAYLRVEGSSADLVFTALYSARVAAVEKMLVNMVECTSEITPLLTKMRMAVDIEDIAMPVKTPEPDLSSLKSFLTGWSCVIEQYDVDYNTLEPIAWMRARILKEAGILFAPLESLTVPDSSPFSMRTIDQTKRNLCLLMSQEARKLKQEVMSEKILDWLWDSCGIQKPSGLRFHVERALTTWALGQVGACRSEIDTVTTLLLPANEKFLLSKEREPVARAEAYLMVGRFSSETNSAHYREIFDGVIQDAEREMKAAMSNQNRPSENPVLLVKNYLTMGKFYDTQYKRLVTMVSSADFKRKVALAERSKQDLDHLLTQKFKGDKKSSDRYARFKPEVEADIRDVEQTKKEKIQYAKKALEYYVRCLELDDSQDIVVFRVCSLWFDNTAEPDVSKIISESQIETRKWIKVFRQLAARLAPERPNNGADVFGKCLRKLVYTVVLDHPYHTLYILLALANADQDKSYDSSGSRTLSQQEVEEQDRMQAAKTLRDKLQKSPAAKTVQLINSLCLEYLKMGCLKLGNEGKEGSTVQFSKTSPFMKTFKSMKMVAVPTLQIPVDSSRKYSDIVYIEKFLPIYGIAGGIHKPKIFGCVGSDGKTYRHLVKGQDDLRQDAVMEQLFGVINEIFAGHPETIGLGFNIRTYTVIPTSRQSGIIEFCENTVSLYDYLCGTKPSPGAHPRYRPGDTHPDICREKIANGLSAGPKTRLQIFEEICRSCHPVFGHFFLETFLTSDTYLARKRAYTYSVATSSIVGYMVGLGDRHPCNILLDENTAEFVHIDLGVAFDQGKFLHYPETVPFRLTRDIIHGMGVAGLEGPFKICCEKTVRVVRESADILETIVEVFLYDPLFDWSYSVNVKKHRQKSTPSFSQLDESERGARNDSSDTNINQHAERALLRFRQKVQGIEGNDVLCVESQVERQISAAMSPANLAMLFQGWQAYL